MAAHAIKNPINFATFDYLYGDRLIHGVEFRDQSFQNLGEWRKMVENVHERLTKRQSFRHNTRNNKILEYVLVARLSV